MPQGMLTGQDLPPVATLALLPAPSSCPGCRCFVVEAGYEVCSTGSAWVANGAGALLAQAKSYADTLLAQAKSYADTQDAQAKSYADTQDSGHASNRSAHGLGVSTAHVEAAEVAPGPHSNLGAEAAVALTLTDVTAGARYRFVVLAAQTLTITAPEGATIRIGADVTGDAGSVEAAGIGSALELVAEADGALVATSFIGTWAQPTTPEP